MSKLMSQRHSKHQGENYGKKVARWNYSLGMMCLVTTLAQKAGNSFGL